MVTQTAIWTLLPNGLTSKGGLKISALLSPRLVGVNGAPSTLSAFNLFVDWPTQLLKAKFTVRYGTEQLSAQPFWKTAPEALDSGDDLSSPDPGLWKGLFPPETYVRPRVFEDLSNQPVLSYPTMHLLSAIEDFYGKLAITVWDHFPEYADLPLLDGQHIMQTFRGTETLKDRDKMINQMKKDNPISKTVSPRSNRNLRQDFKEFNLYHMPPAKLRPMSKSSSPSDAPAKWLTVDRVPLPTESDFAQGTGAAERFRLDFHQMVSSVNQYPALMRRLGLVVDLHIPRPRGLGDVPDGLLSLDVDWPTESPASSLSPTKQPSTHAQLSNRVFVAVSKPLSNTQNGLLNLNQNRFEIIQLDPSGSVMKLSNFARSSFLANNPDKAGETTGVPGLRGPTFALIETGRAARLAARLKHNKDLNDSFEAQQSMKLYAEDLTKGYRIDVLDQGKWRSLCQRIGRYEITGQMNPLIIEDENSIQMGVTEAPDREDNPGSDQLYLGETIFNWGGWSLAAPRPGATVDPEDEVTPVPADVNQQMQNPSATGIRLEANFRAKPGSLPRLRYGRRYRFRARITDLAGNSLPFLSDPIAGQNANKSISKPVSYLRFEPLPSPAMALVLQAGQQPSDLKVEEGESMERLAIRNFNDTALFGGDAQAADTPASSQVSERHIIPPRSSQAEAERHGVLDDAQGNPDKALYNLLVNQDTPLTEHTFNRPAPTLGDPDITACYSYGPVNLSLPYLPDPLAHGVAVRFLDHPALPPDSTKLYPFSPEGAAWPERHPLRIRVIEGSGPPQFLTPPAGDDVLEVPVPKGEVVKLLLGCYFSENHLPLMGIWSWIAARVATPQKLAILRSDVLQGRHWMLTPWRKIHLVNAVQQPLGLPKVLKLEISRDLYDTGLYLSFETPLHRKSTMKLDVFADWNEPRDDPKNSNSPENVLRKDHAFEHKVRIEAPLDKVSFVRERHEIGDTRYRKIRYHLVSTTRYREYFSPALLGKPVDKTKIIRVSEAAESFARNSARPPAPEILYVVPTYGWTEEEASTSKQRDRRGGGLRVYLDRPWYATGYGEMLAVVMPDKSKKSIPIDETLKPFVTEWGQDPIWNTGAIRRATPRADANDFPLARFTAADAAAVLNDPFIPEEEKSVAGATDFKISGLTLSELPNRSVSIAPHVVGYDSERELWYCDIEVRAAKSYTPFIRLALARYHPVSEGNAHLSAAVQAEFTQLAPDRSAVLTQVTGRARKFRLTVHGRQPKKSSAAAAVERIAPFPIAYIAGDAPLVAGDLPESTVVQVIVEKLDATLGSDFGWSKTNSVTIKPYRRRSRALPGDRFLALPELWDGTIELPAEDQDNSRYRIVIREYESFIADPERKKWIERVVYADIFNL